MRRQAAKISGVNRKAFIDTGAWGPAARTTSAEGFSTISSSAPLRARTRAKAAIRSAGMLDSATRAARSKPARALPRWLARSRST